MLPPVSEMTDSDVGERGGKRERLVSDPTTQTWPSHTSPRWKEHRSWPTIFATQKCSLAKFACSKSGSTPSSRDTPDAFPSPSPAAARVTSAHHNEEECH